MAASLVLAGIRPPHLGRVTNVTCLIRRLVKLRGSPYRREYGSLLRVLRPHESGVFRRAGERLVTTFVFVNILPAAFI